MHTYDTMSRSEFLITHIAWIFAALSSYRVFLFHSLNFCGGTESMLILAGMLTGSTIAGFLLKTFGKNGFSVFCDIVYPLGIYTLLAYWPIYGYLPILGTILGVTAALALLYTVALLSLHIQSGDVYICRRVLCRRGLHALRVSRGLFAVGFALMTVVTAAAVYMDYPTIRTSVEPAEVQEMEDFSLEDHMDTLLLLQEDNWAGLAARQKLDVLQTMTDIECWYLGLPESLPVRATAMPDSTNAYYTDNSRSIAINIEHLLYSPARDVLQSLLHEIYHSYQYRLVDAYKKMDEESRKLRVFQTAKTYMEEFADYSSGEEYFFAYYSQQCESDARAYAELSAEDYYAKIDTYLQDQSANQPQTSSE